MKGVIINYNEDRGFGFLKDQNGKIRFFHITDIQEKDEFLNNLYHFIYSDFVPEKEVFIVDFQPYSNKKGLRAKKIILTDEIFNDKTKNERFKAIITNIKYKVINVAYIVQGIKKDMPIPKYATAGGFGTYRIGYPIVYRELFLFFRKIDDIGWDKIEIRDLALSQNNRKKVTKKFISQLKQHLINKIITIKIEGGKYYLDDETILKII